MRDRTVGRDLNAPRISGVPTANPRTTLPGARAGSYSWANAAGLAAAMVTAIGRRAAQAPERSKHQP